MVKTITMSRNAENYVVIKAYDFDAVVLWTLHAADLSSAVKLLATIYDGPFVALNQEVA